MLDLERVEIQSKKLTSNGVHTPIIAYLFPINNPTPLEAIEIRKEVKKRNKLRGFFDSSEILVNSDL